MHTFSPPPRVSGATRPALLGTALGPLIETLSSTTDGTITSWSGSPASSWCIYCHQPIPPVVLRLTLSGQTREVQFPRPKCECQVKQALEEEAARQRDDELRTVRNFHAFSGVPAKSLYYRLADLKPVPGMNTLLQRVDEFLLAWPNRSLVIMGYRPDPATGASVPCYGNGKTHVALGLRNELEQRGYRALAFSAPYLLALLQSAWRASRQDPDAPPTELWFLQQMTRSDLVVADDVGGEQDEVRTFKQEFFWRWMGPRLEAQKPIVMTTTLDPVQLAVYLGQRNFERLAEAALLVRVSHDRYIERR